MSEGTITCHMCGFSNASNVSRCVSCGARLESGGSNTFDDEEGYTRSHQQEGFQWKWALIAVAVYALLQGVVLIVLPMVLPQYDPQGLAGLLISVGLWFVGGLLIGVISPGKTFVEPAVAALILVGPTMAYLISITPDGFQPSTLAYVVGGLLSVMTATFGALVGDRSHGKRPATA